MDWKNKRKEEKEIVGKSNQMQRNKSIDLTPLQKKKKLIDIRESKQMEWCLKEPNPNWNKSLIWNTTKNARFILVIVSKLVCVGEYKSKFYHQILFSKTNNVLIHSPVSSNKTESSNDSDFS
jgi:hypothetical protein